MSDSIRSFYDSINSMRDIQRLIDDDERESITLDYKQAYNQWNHGAKEKIAKHLSAFANSEGGLIIFGVACADEDKDRPVDITGLHPHNHMEDFDRIASAAVRPAIKGMKRKQISENGQSVLVVYVPPSEYAPHQSLKHKQYFHRAGAQSVAMEHYLVQRYFGKNYHPLLEITIIEPTRIRAAFPKKGWTHYYSLQFIINNAGKGNATGCSGRLILPPSATIATHHPTTFFQTSVEETRTWQTDENAPQQHYFVISRDIHPGAVYCFYDVAFAFNRDTIDELRGDTFLKWELFAEGMEPQQGQYRMSESFVSRLKSG